MHQRHRNDEKAMQKWENKYFPLRGKKVKLISVAQHFNRTKNAHISLTKHSIHIFVAITLLLPDLLLCAIAHLQWAGRMIRFKININSAANERKTNTKA